MEAAHENICLQYFFFLRLKPTKNSARKLAQPIPVQIRWLKAESKEYYLEHSLKHS